MRQTDPAKQRHLAWDGCYNARDLGGLPTADGGETRWQAVIRSDLLGRLTRQGQQALLDYGVRTIIDLRAPLEAQTEPSAFTAPTDDLYTPTYLNLPLERYYPHVSALISLAATRAEVYCIILDHYPDSVAAVMRAIADARPGGVVIHCHAGKDRTGIVAALLLGLVGVPAELIAADYTESQPRLWPLYEQQVAAASGEAAVDPWLKPTATMEMMHTMLAHLETRHGGVHAYLTAGGLTGAEIAQLVRRLRSS
ncbi:MAG: tyrosine-protein phosphatase [Roseiflexaceae bacterium]